MTISNAALIVIVLVCCLSSVSLAAAMFGHYSVPRNPRWSPTIEQQRYMRDVRMRNLDILNAESRTRHPRSLGTDQTMNMDESSSTDLEAQCLAGTKE
ncbi:uncharacterized protein N7496_012296 [Penicillium cataractarum]|uniref:Uncharacterized protein n=1 Tax=Penicillium cataractarum TaxID=2100454 RepID=A0A9W9RA88_9EURO|nr:uncharacterized protein N7496_012296 [Penicillium cataractarum]KAJ5355084.1 hypothetical protein N7496_012296 [Penicillium cataractarum]